MPFDPTRLHEDRITLPQLLDAMPSMTWCADADGRTTFVSKDLLTFTGRPAADFLGHRFAAAVHDEDRDTLASCWETAWLDSQTFSCEFRLAHHDDRFCWVRAEARPLASETGVIVGWVGTCTSIDDLKVAQERAATLQHLTGALQPTRRASDVLDVLLTEGVTRVGASRGAVGLVGDAPEGVLTVVGHNENGGSRRVALRDHPPAAAALRDGASRFLANPADAWPALDAVLPEFGAEPALAVLPLRTNGRALGVFVLAYDRARTFDEAERTFLQTLAAQGAQALERARAYDETRAARELVARASSLLDVVFEGAPTGIAVFDPELRYVRVNAAAARHNGRAASEHVGRTLFDLAPDGGGELAANLRRVLETGEPIEGRLMTVTDRGAPGRERHWENNAYPLRDSHGQIVGIGTLFEDVTARHRAEASVRRSEQRYRTLFESMPHILWSSAHDGRVLSFNRHWRDFTGLPTEPDGLSWLEAVHPDDRPRALQARTEGLARGEAYAVDVRFRRFDGQYVWHACRVAPLAPEAATSEYQWLGYAVNVQDRVLAEQALREREAQLSALLDTSQTVVYVQDLQERFVHMNSRGRDVFAHGEDVTGRSPREVFSPAVADAFRASFERVRASNETLVVQETLPHAHGEGSYVSVKFMLRDALGVPYALCGLSTDVTELRRAEDRLRETEDRFRLAARATNDIIWDWRLHDGHVVWNEALGTLFGHADAETSADWWLAHIHPEDRPTVEREVHEVLDSPGSMWIGEYRFRRADGSYADVFDRGFVLRDANGAAIRMIGAMLDASDRKAAEARLRDGEDRLRLATQAAAVGIWDYDLREGALRWDDRTKALFGLPPSAPVTYEATFLGGLHPDDRARTDAAVAAALVPDGSGAYDIEFRTVGLEDGVERWIAASGRAFFEDGEAVRFIGTVLDISERKRIEAELRDVNEALEQRVQERTTELERSNAELRRSNTELERFAYITSHDLQEPIRTVTSYVELLAVKYGAAFDDRARLYVDMALKGTERMKVLVADLLTFSRLSGDQVPLRPLDVAAPLSEALARLERRLTDSKARVTWDELPTVLGDGPQLAQLFQNLLSNAVKFVAPGAAPTVHVGVAREEDVWHFRVSDDGIGMEPQYLERIFVLFQRLHTRDRYDGTGLGLGICQKVIERHGGRIWAESSPGEGSTFHFTLPAVPDRLAPSA